jgi:hypothetical protein
MTKKIEKLRQIPNDIRDISDMFWKINELVDQVNLHNESVPAPSSPEKTVSVLPVAAPGVPLFGSVYKMQEENAQLQAQNQALHTTINNAVEMLNHMKINAMTESDYNRSYKLVMEILSEASKSGAKDNGEKH